MSTWDPDLAFVQERTALSEAMFHSVASHLRQTYAATKDLHALSSVKRNPVGWQRIARRRTGEKRKAARCPAADSQDSPAN